MQQLTNVPENSPWELALKKERTAVLSAGGHGVNVAPARRSHSKCK